MGMQGQLELLQRTHEVRPPAVQARDVADRVRQLELIVKDQDIHGFGLHHTVRNLYAMT